MITPFRNDGHLTEMQRNYNRTLSRNRVKIEHLFGHIIMLWRRDNHLHVRDMEYCAEHIAATFVLHNFRLLHGEELQNVSDCMCSCTSRSALCKTLFLYFSYVQVFNEDEDEDDPFPLVQDAGRQAQARPQNDDDDPHVVHGEAAALLRDAQVVGEAKRWNICNELWV